MFNRLRYWFQHSKRQDLINRFGFYQTVMRIKRAESDVLKEIYEFNQR